MRELIHDLQKRALHAASRLTGRLYSARVLLQPGPWVMELELRCMMIMVAQAKGVFRLSTVVCNTLMAINAAVVTITKA